MAKASIELLSSGMVSTRTKAVAPGLGFFLREAYRAFARALDRRIARYDITHAQWVLLWFLHRAGTLTPGELSRAAGIKKASATSAIEALKVHGLITADRDAVDGRKLNLSLTSAGNALMIDLNSCAANANARAEGGMSRKELAELLRLLRHVAANLECDRPDERPRPRVRVKYNKPEKGRKS